MFRVAHSFLYGGMPAAFESAFSLHDSVERLREVTERSVFGALSKQAAVGRVTEEGVFLQRAIPLVGNSFKPFFVGKFELTGSRVALVGQFTLHRSTKIFMTIWFGFISLWTVLGILAVLSRPGEKWFFPLFGIGMLTVGILLVRVGKWLSRNDAAWLSGVITRVLSRGDAV